MFILKRCKREDYIKAWNVMYKTDKKIWNDPMFDGVNPALNKTPLGTETDNFCVVMYDSEIKVEEFEYGLPVGIFSFVITPRKIIGKQFVVNPNYQGKGLGKALLIENEKTLLENGYSEYYIGCSKCSAGIIKNYWGIEPYSSDVEGDLYKFNVNLKRENFNKLYEEIIINNSNIKVINEDSNTIEELKESEATENANVETVQKMDKEIPTELKENVSYTTEIKQPQKESNGNNKDNNIEANSDKTKNFDNQSKSKSKKKKSKSVKKKFSR